MINSACAVTFPCPSLPSLATAQPTPQPPNPTTGSEETPPTTNQQTQEPMDPLTTSDRPATAISETATDPRSILRPSEPTDIDLIIGIVIIIIVVIAAVVTVVVIMAVLFKRRGNVVVRKTGALANPTYGTKGQYSNKINMDFVTSLNSIVLKLFHMY